MSSVAVTKYRGTVRTGRCSKLAAYVCICQPKSDFFYLGMFSLFMYCYTIDDLHNHSTSKRYFLFSSCPFKCSIFVRFVLFAVLSFCCLLTLRNILSALLFESAVLEAQLHSQVLPFRLGGLAHRPYELQAKRILWNFLVHKSAVF